MTDYFYPQRAGHENAFRRSRNEKTFFFLHRESWSMNIHCNWLVGRCFLSSEPSSWLLLLISSSFLLNFFKQFFINFTQICWRFIQSMLRLLDYARRRHTHTHSRFRSWKRLLYPNQSLQLDKLCGWQCSPNVDDAVGYGLPWLLIISDQR